MLGVFPNPEEKRVEQENSCPGYRIFETRELLFPCRVRHYSGRGYISRFKALHSMRASRPPDIAAAYSWRVVSLMGRFSRSGVAQPIAIFILGPN